MAKKEITYTEAMNEIEQILDRFRREEMTVDSVSYTHLTLPTSDLV